MSAAALYSCVLPLWEGWDEPFHYARIENIAAQKDWGTLGKSTLTAEIANSLLLTPVSRLLAPLIPGSVSFEQWHQLTHPQRLELRSRLLGLPPSLRHQPSSKLNYEAQQAPLAYLVLAPLDLLLSHSQLVSRVLILRLIESLISIMLIYFSLLRLARTLEISSSFQVPLLFCALSVQTLWASIGHVGNDGFAIPLTIWFLALLAGSAPVTLLAFLLGLGLVTKAYFLSFVPVFTVLIALRLKARKLSRVRAFVALLIPIVIAAPWYVRNIALYGSFSGTQESVAGITLPAAMRAIPHINWLTSAAKLCRDSLWSGNWSFTSLSRTALLAEQTLLLIAFALVVANHRNMPRREIWLWAACVCFLLGLFYQTCVTWAASDGLSVSPEPWYGQGILLCLWALLFRGLQAYPKIGRICSVALCLVASWIAAATFIAKLLPGYGGGVERGTLRALAAWWQGNPTRDLSEVAPAPVGIIYFLLGVYLVLLVITVLGIIRYELRPVTQQIQEESAR